MMEVLTDMDVDVERLRPQGKTGTMTCARSEAKRKPRQHKAVGVNSCHCW